MVFFLDLDQFVFGRFFSGSGLVLAFPGYWQIDVHQSTSDAKVCYLHIPYNRDYALIFGYGKYLGCVDLPQFTGVHHRYSSW